MRIFLAQIDTRIGDFAGNVELMLRAVDEAGQRGCDLVIFPELSICGYPPLDLLNRRDFVDATIDATERFVKRVGKMLVLFGTIYRTENQIYNCCMAASKERILAIHKKILLPTYDVFDEARYFGEGDEATVVVYKGKRIGLTVCEDAWNDSCIEEPFIFRRYNRNPIEETIKKRCDLIVNISASPFYRGKPGFREKMFSTISRKYSLPLVFLNQVGGNDSLIFDGSSFATTKAGGIFMRLKSFDEDSAVIELDQLVHESGDSVRNDDDFGQMGRALILGIRDYFKKCGFERAVVGLSGGIDSSLTLLLAERALGKDRVAAIAMPSMFSSKESVEDAKALSNALGTRLYHNPITTVYRAAKESIDRAFGEDRFGVTEENLQARIRGMFLMAFSNRYGHIVLSTGNKSELSMGYCTLYGDMVGGLSVLMDVYKTEVYQIAKALDTGGAIPERVFKKAPSAELRPHQKDSDSLPPYELLDAILYRYVDLGISKEEITRELGHKDVVEWVIKRLHANEYKRRQGPLGLKVSRRSFAFGRRVPITSAFE